MALLEKGTDPNFNRPVEVMEGDNDVLGAPGGEAARNGNPEIVELVIGAGVDATLEGPGLGTSLHQAWRWDHADVVEILMSNHAEESAEAATVAHLLADADLENGRKLAAGCGLCLSLDTGSEEIITGSNL